MKDIESAIIDFFKESPHPEDQEIHALAENLGIDKHEFEEIIYKLFGDTVSKSAMEIPKDEMEKGIEVEKEHKRTITDLYNELENRDPTDDEIEEMAKSIVEDHEDETVKDLTGEPDYYTEYLLPMEEEMKKNRKESVMKINSNTFSINKESEEFQSIEDIIKRIASENKIENVEEVQIKISKDGSTVKFAILPGLGAIGAISQIPAVQQGAQQVGNAVQQGAEQVGVADNPTETIQNAVLTLAQRGTSLEEIQGYLSSIMTNVQQYVASQQQPAQQAQAPTAQAAGA